MKKGSVIALATVLGAITAVSTYASQANAYAPIRTSGSIFAAHNLYVGFGYGESKTLKHADLTSPSIHGDNFENQVSAYLLYMGLKISPSMDIEARYTDFGKVKDETNGTTLMNQYHGISGLLRVSAPVFDKFQGSLFMGVNVKQFHSPAGFTFKDHDNNTITIAANSKTKKVVAELGGSIAYMINTNAQLNCNV